MFPEEARGGMPAISQKSTLKTQSFLRMSQENLVPYLDGITLEQIIKNPIPSFVQELKCVWLVKVFKFNNN